MRLAVCVAIFGVLGTNAIGQGPPTRPPVIDMHVHTTNTTPQQALDRMKQLNIRYLLVSTLLADLPLWASALSANQFAA